MNCPPNRFSTLCFKANGTVPRLTLPWVNITFLPYDGNCSLQLQCMYIVSTQTFGCSGLALATLRTSRAWRASVPLQPYPTLFIHHLITAECLNVVLVIQHIQSHKWLSTVRKKLVEVADDLVYDILCSTASMVQFANISYQATVHYNTSNPHCTNKDKDLAYVIYWIYQLHVLQDAYY